MAIETMERRAADNKYLHREFHNIFNIGLDYAKNEYGVEGVKEYLEIFTKNFYSPLMAEIKAEGLKALERHIVNIYEIEESSELLKTELDGDTLRVSVSACPAVKFIKGTDRPVSDMYVLSSTVVYETIAKETGYVYECISYDEETGAAEHVFKKEA
ncbi:MAG: hypothetical protein E7623_04310 [Ruminococcaceae bacterium]|nr:hypothetical protein [Oscillospiraceae bacterium]